MGHPSRAAISLAAILGLAPIAVAQTIGAGSTSSPPKASEPFGAHGGDGHPPPPHRPPPHVPPPHAPPSLESRVGLLPALVHGPCCHPPPPLSGARIFQADATHHELESAREAATYVHDARFGARVVVYAGRVGSGSHQAFAARRRAAVIARDLVSQGVYAGAIRVVWGARRHYRGVVIEVRRLAEPF